MDVAIYRSVSSNLALFKRHRMFNSPSEDSHDRIESKFLVTLAIAQAESSHLQRIKIYHYPEGVATIVPNIHPHSHILANCFWDQDFSYCLH